MPTAGRLAGAIAFGVLGAYLAFITIPLFEEGKQPGYWWFLCIGAGVWSGWVVVGKRAGRGYGSGIGNGLTGVVAQVFWILFIFSSMVMLQKSLRRSYDGPVEAVVNIFELMIEHAMPFATSDVLTAIGVGGVLGGLVAEYYGRRYP